MPSVRIIGPGRAGMAFSAALGSLGWDVVGYLHRGDPVAKAAQGVDLLLITTPDARIADIASQIIPEPETVVAHVAGSLGLGALAPHPRRGSLHPLMALPPGEDGVQRLFSGGWFAVAGDDMMFNIGAALHGHLVEIDDQFRPLYHAAATIAANHLVALMGQVQRIAELIDMPMDAYLDLAEGSLENVRALGSQDALTGPAARGDNATIARHIAALPNSERETYNAMRIESERLARGSKRTNYPPHQ